MIRVTIACPEALIGDANQLALCLGYGPEDGQTYGAALWQDDAGNRYALASAVVGDGFVALATGPLPAPRWGADPAAGARAQAALTPGLPAAPDRIATIIGDDPQVAVQALGVRLATGTEV